MLSTPGFKAELQGDITVYRRCFCHYDLKSFESFLFCNSRLFTQHIMLRLQILKLK